MRVTFSDLYYEHLYEGKPVKGKPKFPPEVIRQFFKKVKILQQTARSPDLLLMNSLNFEELKGDKQGTYSIRLNKQFRLEFKLTNEEITLTEIVIIGRISKHYE
jgi:toxin HigB-1